MVDKPRADSTESADEPEPSPSGGRFDVKRLFRKSWVIAIVFGTVVFHVAGFWYFLLQGPRVIPNAEFEIGLGDYEFRSPKRDETDVARASFNLYIHLLDEVEQPARHQIAARRFRVQQDIEELLRQAHGADFEDPTLLELKRQLQEQINQSLGMRAIADVIITDLEVERVAPQAMAESDRPAAWQDDKSG